MVESAILQKMITDNISSGYSADYWQNIQGGYAFMLAKRPVIATKDTTPMLLECIRVILNVDELATARELRGYIQRRLASSYAVLEHSLKTHTNNNGVNHG